MEFRLSGFCLQDKIDLVSQAVEGFKPDSSRLQCCVSPPPTSPTMVREVWGEGGIKSVIS